MVITVIAILGYLLYFLVAGLTLISLVNLITAISSLKKEEEYKDFFPRVSVIVRCWNDGSVVERCILNYLSHNYPKKDYVIIIIDDGSTDNTEQICQRYAKEGKIRYVKYPEHGQKANRIDDVIRNYASGEIMLETDVDAVLKPNYIAAMMKPYSDPQIAAATSVVMGGNWYRNFMAKMRTIENFWWFCATMYGRFRLTGQGLLYGGSKSYRRSVWEAIGGHPTKTLVEDGEMAAVLIDRGYKIAIVKEPPVVQEEVETISQYFSEQRRWISGDFALAKEYSKELSRNIVNKYIMYSNFATDGVYLLSLPLLFIQPLFAIPLLISLFSLWIGFAAFGARWLFYIYSIPFIIVSPLLHIAIFLSIAKSKLTGKKIEWTKVWHYPIELIWPTK
jgi:cellulose synthase/poly-beta-1,6-N-acetylglucosamine synthase-like glycosyltransferase